MELKLNASALSSDSLIIPLASNFLMDIVFCALIDSGSSHCFIDSKFVSKHSIPTKSIPPITLRLFDGSSNSTITYIISLPIRFPTGESFDIDFYVTPLDHLCSAVLGYNWLTHYNPLIDWVLGSITFQTPVHSGLDSDMMSTPALVPPMPLPTLTTDSPVDPPTQTPNSSEPRITFLDAVAFTRACKEEGTEGFQIHISNPNSASGRSAQKFDTPVDLSSVPPEYHDYTDVFSKSKANTLPPHRPYDLKINLEEGTSPPLGPIYSLSPAELATLREFINEHLKSSFIHPTNSPYGAPILFVKKKNGQLWLCVDFHGLNQITKKGRYPLPLIADLLDAPWKARVYTKIDIRHAYHLVHIAEGDEPKTTFRTRYGSYKWCVMPFGLTNAPAAFQHFMNDIFADLLDICTIIYLDDILIYSNSMSNHILHVQEALQHLRDNRLYASAKKYEFHSSSVEYLGFILSPDGLTMDAAKIQVIQDWPKPHKVWDIQSFLSFANFYRQFIYNYSDIVIPLTRLTQKGTPWHFSDDCRNAFTTIKKAFTCAPVITHWVPDAQITVETDTLDYTVAAILSITLSDGEIHPVAFYSRTLTTSELNYDTHDKELLAIYESFWTWRHYLEGSATPIDVVTDHKNLEYFSTTKILSGRQARWSELLSQLNLVIRFCPGKLGAKPDALTR